MIPLSKARLGMSDDPEVGARVSLRECLDAALEQSEGLMDRVLDGLIGRGDKAFGMQVKPNFPPPVQAVLEIVSASRFQVKRVFNQRLRENVYQGVGAAAQAPQLMRFEDLKLFEEQDLDESIEVARALQEISLVTESALPTLDALMSSMLGWITVQPQINPLRPEMFALALRECIAELVPDADIRGAILSHAAGRLGILLRRLYLELNAWLKSCGVEEASTVAPGLVQSSVAKPSATGAMGNSVARTLLTLDRLRRLLSGELDGDAPRRPQDFLHTVPASVEALQDMRQVEVMVQRLETKARKAAENPEANAALKKAAAKMALTDNKLLGKQLGEEVVRLMLDNLIGDERLLPGVRNQLQTLEPMLLEIAKADGRFFSDKQHVARQFLDKVTNRSLAFATERDEGYGPFVQSLAHSVQAVGQHAQTVEGVLQAFGHELLMLEAAWEELDVHERALREEAARALQRAEQRNMLAQYLAQEYRVSAREMEVPREVVEFVCGPWAQVVAQAQLQCTDGTSDPQGYHALVAELYWSVQQRVAKRNRKRLVSIIPGMLARLRQGLRTIDFPPERMDDFLSQLIGLHEATLKTGRPQAATPDAASPAAPHEVEQQIAELQDSLNDRAELEALYAAASHAGSHGVAEPAAPRMAGDSGFREENFGHDPAAPTAASAIAIGTWVELLREGQWVRAQLTWTSPHRTLFMFVAHGGKTHSMSLRTLDKLRAQDMIRIVSDGHLVDKALDAVAQAALQNSLNQSPGTSQR